VKSKIPHAFRVCPRAVNYSLASIDIARVAEFLASEMPALNRALEQIEESKKVSQECLRWEVTV
jgi:hypothetical protein